MDVDGLIAYLKTVKEEAGNLPVIVQANRANSHILEDIEVVDNARHWVKRYGSEVIERTKAVVIK